MGLRRAEMEAIIDGGGSVMVNLPDGQGSRTITRKEHLPSHESLGEKDPAITGASREDLEAKRREIEAQLKALDAKPADAKGEPDTIAPIEPIEPFNAKAEDPPAPALVTKPAEAPKKK